MCIKFIQSSCNNKREEEIIDVERLIIPLGLMHGFILDAMENIESDDENQVENEDENE